MENKDNNSTFNDQNPEMDEHNTANNEANTVNTAQTGSSFEDQVKELNDKYLRLYSEFDNYRKRTIKEKSDIIRSAGEEVFKALLPVIDDFERAMKASQTTDDVNVLKEGTALIYNKLKSVCTAKGLEALESVGKPFDSDVMEAITHIPAPSDDLKGKVVDDVEKGYKLGDKVIRFAKVVVGN